MARSLADDPPRVVLFGRSGAGKSSLLGALVEAARTQGEQLGAEIVDPEGTLEPIRTQVYTSSPSPTDSDVIAHEVRLRPWHTGAKAPTESGPVLLLDSAGPAVEGLLKQARDFAQGRTHSTLANAVSGADSILLAIPASADEAELAATFQEFQEFLDAVETRREWERSVGGLPVAIVLTQCDRLAKPGDTLERWQKRIADRRAFILDRLRESFPATSEPGRLAFGSLDWKVFATAVRWPELAEPAREPGPFGVADLFREGFAGAREHRDRVAHSHQQLRWILGSATTLVGLFLAAAVALLARQPHSGAAKLEDLVRSYQRREEPAAERLASRNILHNRQALEAMRDSASFPELPAELREYVELRLREITDYQALRAKLIDGPIPAEARNLDDLTRIEERLTALELPPDYAWGETDAARMRAKWLADVRPLREAVRGWENWYRDLIREAGAFERTPTFDGDWRPDVMRFLDRAMQPPYVLGETLPGSTAIPFARGEAVTFAVPYEFDRIYQARQDWEYNRERLVNLRNLADALGLTSGPDRKPAVLDLPEPSRMGTVMAPAAVLQELAMAYPSANRDYPQWSLERFPEPARSELRRRVRRSFDRGAEVARAEILATMGPNPAANDTPAGWRAVAARLGEPAFPAWGELLGILARMQDPKAGNPVATLATFLRATQFDLTFRAMEVVVPDDLLFERAAPVGPLTITHTPRGGTPQVLRFRSLGEGIRQNGDTTYTFLVEGDGKLVVRPGDGIAASLTLRAGDDVLNLTWADSRCQTYAFEGLNRATRRVSLKPGPGSAIPAVPVLLPDVRSAR